jgi:hypothetical protein
MHRKNVKYQKVDNGYSGWGLMQMELIHIDNFICKNFFNFSIVNELIIENCNFDSNDVGKDIDIVVANIDGFNGIYNNVTSIPSVPSVPSKQSVTLNKILNRISISNTLFNSNIKTLRIVNCNMIPFDLSNSNIKTLSITNCRFTKLPDSIPMLDNLILSQCNKLLELPRNIPMLRHLLISHCYNIKNLHSNMTSLRSLEIIVSDISIIPDTFTELKSLKIENCQKICTIPDSLKNINRVTVIRCYNLTFVPDLDFSGRIREMIDSNYKKYIETTNVKRSEFNNMIKYELLDVAMHPDRVLDWYLNTEEKDDMMTNWTANVLWSHSWIHQREHPNLSSGGSLPFL